MPSAPSRDDFYPALQAAYRHYGAPTLATLARTSQVSKAALSRLINGRSLWPTDRTLHKVLDALGVTLEERAVLESLHAQCSRPVTLTAVQHAALIEEIQLLRAAIDRLTAAVLSSNDP